MSGERPQYIGSGGVTHRMTPMAKRLHELLSDGEWHDREPIVTELMKMVPPGEAWRRAESGRIRQKQKRAQASMSPADYEQWLAEGKDQLSARPRSMEYQIRVGKRAIANSVASTRASNRVETRRTADGKRQLRLRPLAANYLNSRASQLRAEWVHVNGEVKTEEQRKLMNRWVHRTMEQDRRKRLAAEQNS